MVKQKKTQKRPNLERRKRPKQTGVDRWLSSHRIVKLALNAATQRFGKATGVRGLGAGRKYYESSSHLAEDGRICIRVLVEKKLSPINKNDRIPKWIFVVDPKTGKRRRVDLDVVEIGLEHKLESTAPKWPTLGLISPGYRFAHEEPAPADSDLLPANKTLKGTTGAIIRWKQTGAIDGVSAAHVFLGPCGRNVPYGPQALGAQARDWQPIDGADLYPRKIDFNGLVRDVMLFPIPENLRPQGSIWPAGFNKSFAQAEDFEHARQGTGNAMMWVEREQSDAPYQLPLSYAGYNYSETLNTCGDTAFELTYECKYDGEPSVPGDSGAPVFLQSARNPSEWVLLGFHFFNKSNEFSYSMSAENFFINETNSTLGEQYEFL